MQTDPVWFMRPSDHCREEGSLLLLDHERISHLLHFVPCHLLLLRLQIYYYYTDN